MQLGVNIKNEDTTILYLWEYNLSPKHTHAHAHTQEKHKNQMEQRNVFAFKNKTLFTM